MRVSISIILVAFLLTQSVWGDSLFSNSAARQGTPVSLQKARFKVGDIVGVKVTETIDATTTSKTDTKKESEIGATASASANGFLTTPKPNGPVGLKPAWLPNWSIEAENEHKGSGTTKRSSKLSMMVSCVVTKVHENGNLEISGEKQVTVNREDSRIVINGIVRGQDVTTENTVNSDQIAMARIELKGRGPLWNNQRRGMFTKLLDWVSPF